MRTGSQILLDYLLAKESIDKQTIDCIDRPARTEMEVGLTISGGKADAGIAVSSVAKQLHLDFIPIARERFDLVVRRYDYFEPPIQKLLAFCRSSAFIEKSQELGGYDINDAGKVVFNMR